MGARGGGKRELTRRGADATHAAPPRSPPRRLGKGACARKRRACALPSRGSDVPPLEADGEERCGREPETDGRKVRAPLIHALRERGGRCGVPFFVPGHKRGAAVGSELTSLLHEGDAAPASARGTAMEIFRFDLTELDGLDELSDSWVGPGDTDGVGDGCLRMAQNEAASCFGAGRTWFLVNGSTCGIHASVLATCRPGDAVVMPRNVHRSAVHACTLCDTLPVYVRPEVGGAPFGIAHGVHPRDVGFALDAADDRGVRVGAVLVVSPTYFGATTDVAKIAKICHDRGIPLIVDEAHGSHFHFHHTLPPSALSAGADVVVQSTHKTLSAMTQASLLHTRRGSPFVSEAKVTGALTLLMTSSPSYLLMASLDAARAQVHRRQGHAAAGAHPVQTAVRLAAHARERIRRIPGIFLLGPEHLSPPSTCRVESAGRGGDHNSDDFKPELDTTRITVSFAGLLGREGCVSGHAAAAVLREEYGIEAELSTRHCAVFVITGGNTPDDIDALVDALAGIASGHRGDAEDEARQGRQDGRASQRWEGEAHPSSSDSGVGQAFPRISFPIMSPRDVFFCDDSSLSHVRIQDSVGRISAELLTMYPPGVPLVTPGESISREAVETILQFQEEARMLQRDGMSVGVRITGAESPLLDTIKCVIVPD